MKVTYTEDTPPPPPKKIVIELTEDEARHVVKTFNPNYMVKYDFFKHCGSALAQAIDRKMNQP